MASLFWFITTIVPRSRATTLSMALIDVVKWDMTEGEFCYKFPSEGLKIGTQLVVYPTQTAFFVKGGAICDEFTEGTYTIKTENIPILNKLINIPFGGDTPFKAEVWFINQVAKLDLQWGTPHPIQLEDPKYKIIVPVRAHGQYGIKVVNPRLFLQTLIGNMQVFSADKIENYFKGRLVTALNALIAQQIIEQNVSVLDINTRLNELSQTCNDQLNDVFGKYGLSVIEFAIMSITVPESDPSVVKLKEAKDLAARLTITGKDVYQMQRSFDVLEKAAGNEGAGGQMLAMGAGLGAGVGVGTAMGQMTGQVLNTSPATPPPIDAGKTWFIYLNGSQIGGQTPQQIASYIQQGVANGDTLVWAAGMPKWAKIADIPELAQLVAPVVPPPID